MYTELINRFVQCFGTSNSSRLLLSSGSRKSFNSNFNSLANYITGENEPSSNARADSGSQPGDILFQDMERYRELPIAQLASQSSAPFGARQTGV